MGWSRQNYAFDGSFDEISDQSKNRKPVELSSFKEPGLSQGENEAKTWKEVGNGNAGKEWRPRVKTRRILIEPALSLAFMIHMSNYSLINQYLYYAIGEKYNLTAVMESEEKNKDPSTNITGSRDGCGSLNEENSTAYHLQQKVQAEAAHFNMYIDMITDIPGFIVIMFFGHVMDQFGRKPALVLPLTGLIARAVLYIAQMLLELPLEVLYLSGVVETLTGGFSTFLTAAYAVIADTVHPRDRGRRIAYAEICFTIAMAAMSLITGFMIKYLGFLWPFVTVVAVHALNLIYVVFFVPETGEKTAKCSSISPKYVIDSFKVIVRKRANNGRQLLGICVATWIVIGFGYSVYVIDSLYKLNSPFCWTSTMLGIYMAFAMVLGSPLQLFFAAFIYKRVKDTQLIGVALVSMSAGNVITGVATASWMLWISPFFSSLGGMYSPLIRALLSRQVEKNEQGALFACLTAAQKFVGIIASIMFNNVYAATLYFYKGTVYLMVAVFMLMATGLVVLFDILSTRQARKITAANIGQVTVAPDENVPERY